MNRYRGFTIRTSGALQDKQRHVSVTMEPLLADRRIRIPRSPQALHTSGGCGPFKAASSAVTRASNSITRRPAVQAARPQASAGFVQLHSIAKEKVIAR